MKIYDAQNIRNIVLAGHASKGKTTLAEALLSAAGATERLGKVEDGMDVVDKIRKLKTKAQGEHEAVPLDMVVITNVSRFE